MELRMDHAALRAIVDLLPRYAHARRAGWAPAPELHGRIALPEYVLLRRVALQLDDTPFTIAELHARLCNPYSTVDPAPDQLPRLVELGLLRQAGDGYALAPAGRELLLRAEPAANDYAAARLRLPPDDLERLAATMHDIAERQHRAPEPVDKAQQDVVPRLRRLDPRRTPPILLEYALYALQRARDDAHIAAWRAAGFRGPALELLSRIWAGNAATIAELAEQTRGRMQLEDVAALLDELARDGCVSIQPPAVTITSRGRDVRDAIERETDRVYFAPWPKIDAGWVRDRLEAVAAALAASP